jgi:uncharacterized protein YebE (UPF0316 family)
MILLKKDIYFKIYIIFGMDLILKTKRQLKNSISFIDRNGMILPQSLVFGNVKNIENLKNLEDDAHENNEQD